MLGAPDLKKLFLINKSLFLGTLIDRFPYLRGSLNGSYVCYPGVSEYTEYCEENLNLEQSDSHGALDPSVFSDDPETRSRRRAHGQHLEKKRISESSTRDKTERKRHVSKSELKRQLSRQVGDNERTYIPFKNVIEYTYNSGIL